MEKILNKIKIRGVVKYLVQWKEFTIKYDIWKRERELEKCRRSSSKV